MSDKERMIKLLAEVQYLGGLERKIADHLIANGVTFGKDTDVPTNIAKGGEVMTDNEIIKALECCSKDDCDTCPFGENGHCVTMWDALDLIKRQKAEIERLKGGDAE